MFFSSTIRTSMRFFLIWRPFPYECCSVWQYFGQWSFLGSCSFPLTWTWVRWSECSDFKWLFISHWTLCSGNTLQPWPQWTWQWSCRRSSWSRVHQKAPFYMHVLKFIWVTCFAPSKTVESISVSACISIRRLGGRSAISDCSCGRLMGP